MAAMSERAAAYVRMSTEHQKYSTENQLEVIREYAARCKIEIVRIYADEGKSGLRLEVRDALRRLIRDVETGRADFTTILVYDVSRWGRFQDADESAYYEHICKRAGMSLHYCAEQFDNDGSPLSTIVKGVKRAMAGEYSRELSAKVFAGQCRLIELGFRQGGPAGFGLRRCLIDQNSVVKGELARGEHKSIQTDRVILVPGPPEEIEIVRWIYRAFVEDRKTERDIADILNQRGVPTDLGRPWSRGSVHQILINEKYIGNNIWNRTSFKLKKKHVRNGPETWLRSDGAFEAIVVEGDFRHPVFLAGDKLDGIGAPVGGEHEIGDEPDVGGLDDHMGDEALARAFAGRRDLPAHAVADIQIVHAFARFEREIANKQRGAHNGRQGRAEHEDRGAGLAASRHIAVSSPVPAKGDTLLLLGREPGLRPGKQRNPWRRIEPLFDRLAGLSRLPIGEPSEKRVCREQDRRQKQGAR